MRRVLGTAGQVALGKCACQGALLAFDFDGTLAPIVAEPRRAALRPETHRLLAQLARQQPCLVLSGREPADLAARLRGIPLVGLVGNHGASFGLGSAARAAARAQAIRWRRRLAKRLEGRAGLQIQDEGMSLAIHFRGASDPPGARRAIRRAVKALPGACALDGKYVVNVLPAAFAHKGIVLQTIARESRSTSVLFVGDDVTDEAAFRTAVAPRYLTIRVGRDAESAASFYLSSQADIDELLKTLLRRTEGRLSAPSCA
jgi:trehalose 6-phosphate phosphatase